MTTEEEKYFVCLGMRTYGGSFVQKLGSALDSADHKNRLKIKLAFPEYWNKYLKEGIELSDYKPSEELSESLQNNN